MNSFESSKKPGQELAAEKEDGFENISTLPLGNGNNLDIKERRFQKRRDPVSGTEKVAREPSIKITTKNGDELLDLKSLAPEGTILKRSESWRSSLREEENQPFEVSVGSLYPEDEKEVAAAKILLSFLHEVGHLYSDNPEEGTQLKRSRMSFYSRDAEDKHSKNSPEYIHALADEKRVVLRSERNAWAFAFKKARFLKREYGIDILKQLKGLENLFDFVNHASLGTYEQSYRKRFADVNMFTEEEMGQLLGQTKNNNSRARSGQSPTRAFGTGRRRP